MGGCISSTHVIDEKMPRGAGKKNAARPKCAMRPIRFDDTEKYKQSVWKSPQSTTLSSYSFSSQSIDCGNDKSEEGDYMFHNNNEYQRQQWQRSSSNVPPLERSSTREFDNISAYTAPGCKFRSSSSDVYLASLKEIPRFSNERPMERSWERIQAVMKRNSDRQNSLRSIGSQPHSLEMRRSKALTVSYQAIKSL